MSRTGEKRGLACPECGSHRTRIKDSRAIENRKAIRRRRFCQDCQCRWTTWEYTLPPSQNTDRRPSDWQQLTDEQRRILTRIIHDFARDNQKIVRLSRRAG